MELNWTIEVILYYIAAAIMSLAFSILIYNYTKKHERHVLYIMLAYIFGAIFLWQEGSAYLLLYMPFLIYAPLWGFVSGYALILGIDSISSERIDPIKMIIWTGLITTVLYFFFQPGSFTEHTFPNGDKSVAFSGVFQYVVNAYEFYPAILYVYYAWKINRLAPPKLKMDSRLFFAGSIVTTLWPAILALTRISLLIPGIHMLGLGLGSLFTAIAFAKQSKLAFILPFKAGRLIVFDLRSGQSLFSYNWQVSIRMSEDIAFSGIIHSVGRLLKESVNQGEVQEIEFSRGILLLHRSNKYPIACVLVSNKTSPSLRRAFNGFAESFYANFGRYLSEDFSQERYQSAEKFVTEWFAFVPTT